MTAPPLTVKSPISPEIFILFQRFDSVPKIKQKNLEKMLDKSPHPGYNNKADFGNENNMAA